MENHEKAQENYESKKSRRKENMGKCLGRHGPAGEKAGQRGSQKL